MAKKLTKIPGGLKSQGMRNAKWDKMAKQANESAEKAPHEQMHGSEAKKISEKK